MSDDNDDSGDDGDDGNGDDNDDDDDDDAMTVTTVTVTMVTVTTMTMTTVTVMINGDGDGDDEDGEILTEANIISLAGSTTLNALPQNNFECPGSALCRESMTPSEDLDSTASRLPKQRLSWQRKWLGRGI